MIETYLLEQFAAFARYGTLLKTAEELHISQPTLSRSMKKLEDELGVSIFHRENSRLSLNETGKIAAEYAEKALAANQDMIDRVTAFDRSLKTVSVGACSPFPISALMPTLQNYLPDKTILTEMKNDDLLIAGLKSRRYHLAVLHTMPEDKALSVQRYMDENLYITLPADHALAGMREVTFEMLRNERILMMKSIGFWMDVCEKHMNMSSLLIQNTPDALSDLIEASSLPFFNSDRMMDNRNEMPGRISIPISDDDAHATYWIACLASEKNKYRSIFNAARGSVISG